MRCNNMFVSRTWHVARPPVDMSVACSPVPPFNCVVCASRGFCAAHRLAVECRDGVGHVRVRQEQVSLVNTAWYFVLF